MFKKLAVAAVAVTSFASFAAFADDITTAPAPQLTRTRAEVQAETLQALKVGATQHGEAYVVTDSFKASKSPADVQAELRQYERSGQAARDRVANGGN